MNRFDYPAAVGGRNSEEEIMNQAAPKRRMVYVIGSATSSRVKIGTSADVHRRLGEIQRMSPDPLEVLWQTLGDHQLESVLHGEFADRRVHGEWFDFKDENAVILIEHAVESYRRGGRLIHEWLNVGDVTGYAEEGALRFCRGVKHLHRGYDRSHERDCIRGPELDRCGEILAYSFHYLSWLFSSLSGSAAACNDEVRAAGWMAASDAVDRAQMEIVNAVSPGYRWNNRPDFLERLAAWDEPMAEEEGCDVHWTYRSESGQLPCEHLHRPNPAAASGLT